MKFDILESWMNLLEQEAEAQTGNVSDPNQQAQTQNVPTQQPNSSEREPFRDLIGGTISNVAYKKAGSNGGQLTITTSNSHIPTVISWIGTKTSLRLSNGNIILLSE